MVFCRQCQKQVEDCEHCVYPISAPRHAVADEKVREFAYDERERVLEITFKTGQSWQLIGVPPGICAELRESTISSFLRFIARRYTTVPVKSGIHAVKVPEEERCPQCKAAMTVEHRTESSVVGFVRVRWRCPVCKFDNWQTYGNSPSRERRAR
jgi:YD repeat-containing protein